MQDPKLEVVSTFKYEKRLKIFVAIYLSMILLVIAGVLVKVDMATELQQVLVVILGLITIATLDAFRKVLENTSSSVASRFNQIVVQEGGFYVNGGYYVNGNINQGGERKQTLGVCKVVCVKQ
jgi:undecaprenyl pyrophosphate phosphatase UppP